MDSSELYNAEEKESFLNSENAKESPKPQKKVKAKFGAKPFAFFSGVLDVLTAAAIFFIGTTLILNLSDAVHQDNDFLNLTLNAILSPLFIIIAVIFFIGGLLFLILGIMTLVSSFKSDRRNTNGLLKAVIVFDVLLLIISIFFLSASSDPTFFIILTVVLAVGIVFKIIDISLTKKRLKKYQAEKAEEYNRTYKGPNFQNLGGGESSQPQASVAPKEGDAGNNNGDQGGEGGSGGVDFSKLGQ